VTQFGDREFYKVGMWECESSSSYAAFGSPIPHPALPQCTRGIAEHHYKHLQAHPTCDVTSTIDFAVQVRHHVVINHVALAQLVLGVSCCILFAVVQDWWNAATVGK
jgi:hypothetical protein